MAETLRREVEVDTALGELHERLAKVYASLDSNKLSLASLAGVKAEYVTRNRREVRETVAELLDLIGNRLATGALYGYNVTRAEDVRDRQTALEAERDAIRAEMTPLDDEYLAHPWSRFFLVTSSAGGHIHSSTHCSTCRPRTTYGWLPGLSGLTEKDAVEAHGTILCSVCFPTAPTEWTVGNKPKVDPNQCPGSGTSDFDQDTYRRMGISGNGRARCTHCGTFQGVTTNYNLRKHKKAVA
jgi:hypothetical protein